MFADSKGTRLRRKLVAGEGFEPSKVWGFTERPRLVTLVAGEGFEPSKVWGFTERSRLVTLVAGEGFEPSKAEPGDLQSSSLPPISPRQPPIQPFHIFK